MALVVVSTEAWIKLPKSIIQINSMPPGNDFRKSVRAFCVRLTTINSVGVGLF